MTGLIVFVDLSLQTKCPYCDKYDKIWRLLVQGSERGIIFSWAHQGNQSHLVRRTAVPVVTAAATKNECCSTSRTYIYNTEPRFLSRSLLGDSYQL